MKQTHAKRLLALLIENGTRGVNSFDPIRRTMPQISFVITQLQDEGYVISHIDRPDRSTTYVLQHVPMRLKDAAKAITRPPEARKEEPPLYCAKIKSVNEQKTSIEELLTKIIKLREEYRTATEEMKPIIAARGKSLKNAIAKIDPAHPSLSSGRGLAR